MASGDGFICRKVHTIVDEAVSEAAMADAEPLRKVAVAAVGANPWAGRHGDDLTEMITWGASLGAMLGERAARALGAPVLSYGKAAIVGVAGEQEHGVALLTTSFGDALREAVGGGLAWISSATKRGVSGTVIDVPLAHKDALYVRDHYDALEVRVPDAPLPDEIVVIAVVANRGRLHARCGGLSADEVSKQDGLR
jgi:Amino acid synthesis